MAWRGGYNDEARCGGERRAGEQDRHADHVAGVDVGVGAMAVVGAGANVSVSHGVGRLSSELLALCEVIFRRPPHSGSKELNGKMSAPSLDRSPLPYRVHFELSRALTASGKGVASAANSIGVPLSYTRHHGGRARNSDIVMDFIEPNVLPSTGAWYCFFGHIVPSATSEFDKTPQRWPCRCPLRDLELPMLR
eukprot:jgi/Tetstr1/458978/TSEL_004449.t1